MNIQQKLFSMQDLKYKEFSQKLIPSVFPDNIIGVRIPKLREIAKGISVNSEFMRSLPHKYLEENHLHGFVISNITDFDLCIKELSLFLPFIDNWATCDGIRPKSFKKNKNKLYENIKSWLASNHTYTIRFGILMCMIYYLDDGFDERILKDVSEIKSNEYYVNMMTAWFFATALAKQWGKTITILENKELEAWVHNKTIQKATESRRISEENKELLRRLKIK